MIPRFEDFYDSLGIAQIVMTVVRSSLIPDMILSIRPELLTSMIYRTKIFHIST